MPVMEIIRHKAFTVVRKAAKSAKVSWYMVSHMPCFEGNICALEPGQYIDIARKGGF